MEGLAELAASLAAPVALTLGLILLSTTPAHAPGIAQPGGWPVSRDELRLRDLSARLSAGDPLTADEEAELIALLAKVRGIKKRIRASCYRASQNSYPGPFIKEA